MELLKKQFESTLKTKLGQKANAAQGEEALLTKSFRYFDANNDGHINLDEWRKGLEKVGVVLSSAEDLQQLFTLYDTDGDGLIDCKEFAWVLYSDKPFMHFPLYYTY